MTNATFLFLITDDEIQRKQIDRLQSKMDSFEETLQLSVSSLIGL